MEKESQPGLKDRPSSVRSGEGERKKEASERRATEAGLAPHWGEIVSHIGNCLAHIKEYARLSEGRFVDKRFGEHFSRSVNRDVEKIDALLKEYADYLRVNTPLDKTDTVHSLMEATLKRFQGLLKERGINVFKKFEPGLPETTVPDEPLGFILNSLLWYALTWLASIASMECLTRTLPLQIETVGTDGILHRKERHDIEIILTFSGYREPSRSSGPPVSVPVLQRDGIPGFMLYLIEEIIVNNRGELKLEEDPKKARILFSLKFPVERRRKVIYPSSDK
jgi:hypothetical protein